MKKTYWFLIMFFLIIVLCIGVHAATEDNSMTLRPNGVGAMTDIDYEDPAVAHYLNVDDVTPDGLTTVVYQDPQASYYTDVYNLTVGVIDNASTINNVTVYCNVYGEASNNRYYRTALYDASVHYGVENRPTVTWSNISTKYETNPDTSVAWTWEDIMSLQAGVSTHGSNGKNGVCTQVYVIVNYTLTDIPNAPTGAASDYNTTSNVMNLSWTEGNYTDSNVVVRSATGCPSSVTDGTIVQNSSVDYYTFTPSGTMYYAVFSFNSTYSAFSDGLCLPWGAVGLNCFNESNPSQSIIFDIEISNQDGTDVYKNTSLSNTFYINYADIPFGSNTIFTVENISYKLRQYYYDLEENTFYNLSFYLPPEYDNNLVITTKAVIDYTSDLEIALECNPESIISVEGYNESIYGHWFPIGNNNYILSDFKITVDHSVFDENTTAVRIQYYCGDSTSLITLRVIDEYSNPVNDALITIKKYMNNTDVYETVSRVLTDGNGYVTCYLVQDKNYKFVVEKTGFITGVSDWIPSGQEHVFKIYFTNLTGETIWDDIHFDVIPFSGDYNESFDFFFNITSYNNRLVYANLSVFYFNDTIGNWVRLFYFNESDTYGFYFDNITIYTTYPLSPPYPSPLTGHIGGTTFITYIGLLGFQCTFKKQGFPQYTFGVPYLNQTVVMYNLFYSGDYDFGNASYIDTGITRIVGESPVKVGNTIVPYTSLGISVIITILLFTFSAKFAGLGLIIVGLVLGWFRNIFVLVDNSVIQITLVVGIIIFGVLSMLLIKKEE